MRDVGALCCRRRQDLPSGIANSTEPAEGHRAGRDIGYCHLEKLTRLEELPATGFTVCCFPVKIKGASAGWCRAVALVDGSA